MPEYSLIEKHSQTDASAGQLLVFIGNVENWSRS